MNEGVAAVDCGSNSTRLLILDADGSVIARELRITRLSAGVDATGNLDADALQRTLTVIDEYRARWQAAGVTDRVRIAATSAVRDAANRAEFFDGVRRLTGVEAEVLSGDDEARLSFAGAVGAVDVPFPTAVVDIGGGSTELVLGDDAGVMAACSMQLGSVRITERHLQADPPSGDQVAAARRMTREALAQADATVGGPGFAAAAALVGVAGTVTTLAALHLGVDGYDPDRVHGSRMTSLDVEEWTDRLLSMSTLERATEPAIQTGREDVIHAGALILAEVMDRYGFDEVVVSEADILDGLAQTLR